MLAMKRDAQPSSVFGAERDAQLGRGIGTALGRCHKHRVRSLSTERGVEDTETQSHSFERVRIQLLALMNTAYDSDRK